MFGGFYVYPVKNSSWAFVWWTSVNPRGNLVGRGIWAKEEFRTFLPWGEGREGCSVRPIRCPWLAAPRLSRK